jgi:hypothetical protein
MRNGFGVTSRHPLNASEAGPHGGRDLDLSLAQGTPGLYLTHQKHRLDEAVMSKGMPS